MEGRHFPPFPVLVVAGENLAGLNNTPLSNPTIPESQAFWSQDTPAALFIEACPGALHMELHPVGYGVIDPYTIGSGTCP